MKRKIGFASEEYCKQRTADIATGKLQPRPNDKKSWYALHIVRNAAQCKACGDVIESNQTNDYVKCSCGAIAVDGGLIHLSRTGKPESLVELSEFEFEFTLDFSFPGEITPENALERLHQAGLSDVTEVYPGEGRPERLCVVFRKREGSFSFAKIEALNEMKATIPGSKYEPYTDEYLDQFKAKK